jgi:2-octaprenyl-6-methoxyphenol hydroxylase
METPDVRIVGAGPVGLALACALSGHGLNITVHDAGPPEGFASDSRILALSFGTVQLLERLGIGPLPLATPIKTVHVSQKGYLGRTLLRASEYALPCLGQVVRAKDLTQALQKAVCDRGIGIEYHSRLESSTFNAQEGRMTGHLVSTHPDSISDRQPVSARLFAFAEGRIHPETGDAVHEKTYHQHALISLVRPEKPHEHQAWERFTAQGPVALLPFGPEFAVVHTVPSDAAQGLLALEDAAYLRVLERAFGRSVRFVQVRERAAWPLVLRYRKTITAPGAVWLGNAAQTLHPVAGQGFNLALRDVVELARHLPFGTSATSPQAWQAALQNYVRARQSDRGLTLGLTDGLVRIFGHDAGWVAHLRGMGLIGLDLCTPLRAALARQMIWGLRS